MVYDVGRPDAELYADLELARSVYDATQLRAGPSWHDLAADRTDVWLAAGLLQRSRYLLKAVLALHDADMLDAADGMVRSVLDYSITGHWLLEGPDWALDRLMGSALTHLREMEELKPESYEGIVASFLKAFPDTTESRLPGMQKRMGTLSSLYWVYKFLCETTHPSVVASFFAYDWDEGEDILVMRSQDNWQREVPAQFILVSTFWVWMLATAVEKVLGENTFDGDLADLGTELLAAVSYDSDTDTFQLPDGLSAGE